jgi:tetratricopeptide (TPR) repeat protein
MIRHSRLLCLFCLTFAALPALGRAAEVRPVEFLRALQEKGYSDVAVQYLEFLQKNKELPPELAETWDLEMAKSLRGMATSRAFDAKDKDRLANQAQEHLNKFLQEKPNHPEVVSALVSGAMFSMDRALQHLQAAKSLGDKEKEQKAKHLTEARALLDEARPRFKQAIERFEARLAALQPVPAPQPKRGARQGATALAERQRLDDELLEAGFQAALLDYYIAQTYADPNAEARKQALQTAAKGMDRLWQRLRFDVQLGVNPIGLYAHMWHGKITDELGDYQTAKDIYEEVLVFAPEPNVKNVDPAFEPLFAQVQQFAFAITARQDPAKFLEEATQWLKAYAKRWRQTEGYQGVSLEVAKAKLALAGQAGGTEKKRLTSDALALLNDMRKIPSPYQREAFELRKKCLGERPTGTAADAQTFDEALALAEAAFEGGQWDEAASAYNRAVELSRGVRDAGRVAKATNGLANAKYNIAYQMFKANKWKESLAAADTLAQDDTTVPVAPQAASLAMAAALNLYVEVPASETTRRQNALTRLERIAEFTEKTWPDKPEADDARLYRGQALQARGELDKAIAVYDNVNPKSQRYPRALTLAAVLHWQRYLSQKGNPALAADKAGKDKLAAERAKASEKANAALLGMGKLAEAGKPLSPQHVEAQFLVAQIHFEAGQYKEAVAQLRPLVDSIKASKPETLDSTTVRICVIAVQTYLALGDTARAGEVGMILADAGEDIPQVNAVLVQFVYMLDQERKKADAALVKATSEGNAKGIDEARTRLASTQGMIGSVLKKLLARKQYPAKGLVILADAASDVGLAAEARGLYNQVVNQADAEAGLKTYALAQLVGLLRREGKFEEAYRRADQLVKENPKPLAPLIERARVMQGWAEKDPTKFDEAMAEWIRIRNLLQPMRPKPKEYYEVIYYAATCLYLQAQKVPDQAQQKAVQAAQWLKSAMLMNKNLSGPDMVERYKALLEKLKPLLGEKPPAPTRRNA